MAQTWVKYALSRDDVEIVALVDVKEENARATAARHELTCNVYRDIAIAIKASDANTVFNVTTPEAHRDIVITSLKLG